VQPDREIVVCPDDPPDDTYTLRACSQCLEPVWISQDGAKLVETSDAEAMCLACSVVVGLTEGPLPKVGD